MRKFVILLTVLLLLLTAAAAESTLVLEAPQGVIHPGKAATICFTAPRAGTAEILLKDLQGQTLSVVVENFAAEEGDNILWWNGTYQGVPAPEGEHQLVLILDGETAAVPVTVGGMAPYLTNITVDSTAVTPAVPVNVSYYASVNGTLTVGLMQGDVQVELETVPAAEGQQTYQWKTDLYTGIGLADGEAFLTLMLADETGFCSNEEHIALTVTGFTTAQPTAEPTAEPASEPTAEPTAAPTEAPVIVEEEILVQETEAPDQSVYTPAYGSPYQTDASLNYWTLPMDITDEEAVWEVLMQPMTILYSSKDKADRTQVVLRAEPSEDSEGVGVVTRMNQGVHVLEKGEEWTLIECYSSSFHNSEVKRWNQLVQGYVETKHLKEIEPQQEYGIVIDKLTQRMYIFREGKLFTTLLVSTGLTNAKQPYNETRSGEFMLTSPVGAFASGNTTCSMAIRFNSGDLLHEVPHRINADGSKNYSYDEPKLGEKASHGCIRVQRRKNPEGVNMSWLWNNREWNTKLLIWEDWQGRQIATPDGDLTLYYNPDGGSLYHSSSFCYSAQKIEFQPFSYSQLEDEEFDGLKRCSYCAPALRVSEIEAINAQYAPGGDHDPILTEARLKQLESEKKD